MTSIKKSVIFISIMSRKLLKVIITKFVSHVRYFGHLTQPFYELWPFLFQHKFPHDSWGWFFRKLLNFSLISLRHNIKIRGGFKIKVHGSPSIRTTSYKIDCPYTKKIWIVLIKLKKICHLGDSNPLRWRKRWEFHQ